MSIDVLWEEMRWSEDTHEPGQSHVVTALRDESSLVERFLADSRVADFPYLGFISHETVTIFHQQHIPQLVKELEALCKQDHEPVVETHLRAVLEFIRGAYGRRNTHIAFRPNK